MLYRMNLAIKLDFLDQTRTCNVSGASFCVKRRQDDLKINMDLPMGAMSVYMLFFCFYGVSTSFCTLVGCLFGTSFLIYFLLLLIQK